MVERAASGSLTAELVVAEGLSHRYGQTVALAFASCVVVRRDRIALLGRSSSAAVGPYEPRL